MKKKDLSIYEEKNFEILVSLSEELNIEYEEQLTNITTDKKTININNSKSEKEYYIFEKINNHYNVSKYEIYSYSTKILSVDFDTGKIYFDRTTKLNHNNKPSRYTKKTQEIAFNYLKDFELRPTEYYID